MRSRKQRVLRSLRRELSSDQKYFGFCYDQLKNVKVYEEVSIDVDDKANWNKQRIKARKRYYVLKLRCLTDQIAIAAIKDDIDG